MKAAVIILASLMGHALAAPASVESNVPASGSLDGICLQGSRKVSDKCLETRQRGELADSLRERCNKGEQLKPDQEEATQNNPSESETTGQTIDKYCQVMEATSNALYNKQFCLDAFKRCGNPTSLNDAKAKDCANQMMTDKFLWRTTPTNPDSEQEEQQSEDGDESIDLQPNTSTQKCK